MDIDIAIRMKYLSDQVLEHRRRYYILDQPVISDAEYDTLERELRQLEADYPLLADPNSPTNRVGVPPLDKFDKVGHRTPMLSLDNAYSEEDMRNWEGRVKRGLPADAVPLYCADLKVDGLSLALRYEGRMLVRAITRGDGETGEDVTENARAIADIPLELPMNAPETAEVRGEVFLSRKRWEELNTERDARGEQRFANPRNAASGTMKLLDSREVAARRLQFMPWQLLEANDHAEAMLNLSKWGFASMPAKIEGGMEKIIPFIDTQQDARLKLPFDTDGIVIKIQQAEYQQILGNTDRAPRWAIAFKYPATQITSTLIGITWQVGRSGRLTPVAELEPIELAGSTVRRATLHNFDELKRLGAYIGCKVFLEKGGDVIPKVVAVVPDTVPDDAIAPEMPPACPICSGTVGKDTEDEVAIRCQNDECPAKFQARLRHFGSKNALDIEGLGDALVDQLVASQRFNHPWEILGLLKEPIQSIVFLSSMERMAKKSARNFMQSLADAKVKPLWRWIHALGIPFIGAKTAENLAQAFGSLESLWSAEDTALLSVGEIGPKIARVLKDYFQRHPCLPAQLSNLGIIPEKPAPKTANDLPLSGQTAVVTGTLPTLSREEAENLLVKLGAKVKGSVSRKTTVLIAGEKTGSKLEKAQEFNIPIRDESWLKGMSNDKKHSDSN
ncbi:MAG: NAD-dependent DNA ligase LigA [Holophagales bacterium]|jgi:DNA ligase (NAD+)|nr:NAD-dependent DNA ligase LigA [Holophagales bacterium]